MLVYRITSSLPRNVLLTVEPGTRPSTLCTEYQPEEHESVERLRIWKGRSSKNNGCRPRLFPVQGSSLSEALVYLRFDLVEFEGCCRKELPPSGPFASYSSPLIIMVDHHLGSYHADPKAVRAKYILISGLHARDTIVHFIPAAQALWFCYEETRSCSEVEARILNKNGGFG